MSPKPFYPEMPKANTLFPEALKESSPAPRFQHTRVWKRAHGNEGPSGEDGAEKREFA